MSDQELASLGEAEAEILSLVWELGEATVQDIHEKLPADRDIAPATVQTVLRRLRDKGYIKHRVAGKAHIFSPAIKPEKVINQKVRRFLDRFFGGDAVPLLMHLARNRSIDQDDLKRLQEMLAKKSKE
jgi:BlaI family transcriptional regulator, penicillinase repressor